MNEAVKSVLPTPENPWRPEQADWKPFEPQALFGPPISESLRPDVKGIRVVGLSEEVQLALGFIATDEK